MYQSLDFFTLTMPSMRYLYVMISIDYASFI